MMIIIFLDLPIYISRLIISLKQRNGRFSPQLKLRFHLDYMIFNLVDFLNIFLTYLNYFAIMKLRVILSTILFAIELLEQLIKVSLFVIFAA